jgi:hypothetical protein
MNSLIRVTCPKCGKNLKAPQSSAGKRVQCPRVDCRRIFVVPGAQSVAVDLDFRPHPPTRPKLEPQAVPERNSPHPVLWMASILLLLGLSAGVGFWWVGWPDAALMSAYEDYIRTGEELVALHDGLTDHESAKRLEGKIKAKAEEHVQCWQRMDELELSASKRKRALATNKFEGQIGKLTERFIQLTLSKKPLIVMCKKDKATNQYSVISQGDYAAASDATPSDRTRRGTSNAAAKPPTPNWKLESFAGHWIADTFSFDIAPDGKGRAEFTRFSQGTGSFSISQGTRPVKLTADFRIESRDGKPFCSFELTAGPGMVSQYEFEILPGTGADELKVKELRGGRINPNPAVLRRKVAPSERWEVVDVSKGRHYTAAVNDAPGGMVIFGGRVCIRIEETPGKGPIATPVLDEPGHLWIVGKGGVTWKGDKFPAGSIVRVGEDRQPKLADGQFRAWFQTSKPVPAYESPDAQGPAVHTFPANSKVRILIPDSDKTGYHKVFLDENGEKIAWIPAAAADQLVFTERIDGGAGDPQQAQAGAIGFSELKVTKTTFTPPAVDFTIRLDLAGGDLLEAWASVGISDAAKTLEVFAGALHGGLLGVNGIDFANPDPSLNSAFADFRSIRLPNSPSFSAL